MENGASKGVGGPIPGRLIPLSEWIALSSFLEKQQAKESRREAQLAYIERAALASFLLVDKLVPQNDGASEDSESSPSFDFEAKAISVNNFAMNISAECDIEDPSSLNIIKDVQFVCSSSRGNNNGANEHNGQPLSEILQNLGYVLYQLFSRGKAPQSPVEPQNSQRGDLRRREELDDDENDEEQPGAQKGRQRCFIGEAVKSLRRIQISNIQDSLSELNVPETISTLLRDLVEPDNEDEGAFQSLEDVRAELSQIIENPNLFIYEGDTGKQGEIDFGENIVGRTAEVSSLLEAAARTELPGDGPNDLVLVKGIGGSGKTHLIEKVCDSLIENGWVFVSCKFDSLIQSGLSPIASGFDKFFQQLISMASEGMAIEGILTSVQNNLSASGIVVLSDLIPSLRTLFPAVFASIVMDDSSDEEDDCPEDSNPDNSIMNDEIISDAGTRKNRLHYLFRRLVHAISRPEHPCLFFLDDLQWIGKGSIELLSSLLSDRDHLVDEDGESQCALFVASYRTEEVDDTHILSEYLKRLEEIEAVNISNINLGAIKKSDANILVSQALHLPVRRTQSLTNALYAKTLGGNPLLLKIKLKSLIDDEKALSYSLTERCWVWDIEKVKATSIDDNVAVMMTHKLQRLPENVQKALKIISCLGTVDERLMHILLSLEFHNILPSLEYAWQEGILESAGGSIFRFAHQMIQRSAYELMSPMERCEYHATIGLKLTEHLSLSIEPHHITFAAADQMNMAKSLASAEVTLGNQSSYVEFSKLNLVAGERSIEVSDFLSALDYLQHGIAWMSFLPQETRWGSNYELSLRLHESSCLACYINARPDMMKIFLEELLENARCFEDTLKGLFVLVQSLTSSGKLQESIDKVFSILDNLGESFPNEVTPAHIHEAMMSTKLSLDSCSKDDLLSAPLLNDKRLQWVMRLMAYISPYMFMLKPNYIPLIACRIVNISTKHGVCNETAFGLASYSYCNITILRDVDLAYRWCKIAISLLESLALRIGGLNSKILIPKLRILSYHMIFFWKEPIQSTSDALLQCYREALLVGDNEYASFGAHFYCAQNILSGNPLATVEKECTSLALKMVQLNQLPSCFTHLTNHQSVLRLIGSEKNPFDVLKDFAKNEDQLLHHALSTGRMPLAHTIYFNRLFVSFYFKRYEQAKTIVEWAENHKSRSATLKDTFQIFYAGLAAFHFSRCPTESNKHKWTQVGEKSLSLFRTWVHLSKWNWENKLLLLEAEFYFSKSDMKQAEEKYKLAIESARQHRFIHEEGLGSDLCSAYHTANGNVDKAKEHRLHARSCYERWGANALVELLDSIND